MTPRALAAASLLASAAACTNLLISKGASADGSVIVAYNADDDSLFGSLDHRPAAAHAPGSLREIWDVRRRRRRRALAVRARAYFNAPPPPRSGTRRSLSGASPRSRRRSTPSAT